MIVDAPVTLSTLSETSPELLLNEIDRRVVKIRPMSTPVDQISRWVGSRHAGSMVVDYYSVDTKPIRARVTSQGSSSKPRPGSEYSARDISTDFDRIFQQSETLIVPSVTVGSEEGKPQPLILYVIRKHDDGITVISPNNVSGVGFEVPDLPVGTEIVRMGRAATELDVQTGLFDCVPQKQTNYCQIFKAQVERSTMVKIANKEVGWTLSDQEEAAVIDMRLGMEKNFLFGARSRFTDPQKGEEVFLTGGIWNQTGNEWNYARGSFDNKKLIELMRQAFTENAGSSRKILIGGSGFIEALHQLDYARVVTASETVTKWGIDFTELRSKFGKLYVVLSEVFDQCGHSDDAMIIDPEYITKYTHVPFHSKMLDLRASGQRNTDAVVITEASCLVLRYPKAHLKIKAGNPNTTTE